MMTQNVDVESMPGLTDTDRENLAAGDENFHPHTWKELQQIIAANDLRILKRQPSELRRYHAWSTRTKAEYGPITKFVCNERLHWETIRESPETGPVFAYKDSIPFQNPNDFKILLNDWPYGIAPDITHVVVWSKVPIPDQKPEGYLTTESATLISDFVQRTFVERLAAAGIDNPRDRVLWFRNWTGLQSVRGLEHIHLFLRNVSPDLLEEWTGSRKHVS